jgi:hypothetical protein
LPPAQVSVEGRMGLLQQGARCRHLRSGADRLPAHRLRLPPAPPPRLRGPPGPVCHVGGTGAEPGAARPTTPGPPAHPAGVAPGAEPALERQRGAVSSPRAQCYAEAAVGSQPRRLGHRGGLLAVPSDAVGPDRAHLLARGALDPPEGAPAPADTGVRGGTRPARAAAPTRRVWARQAKGAKASEVPRAHRGALVK